MLYSKETQGKLENNFIKIKENKFDSGNSPQSPVIVKITRKSLLFSQDNVHRKGVDYLPRMTIHSFTE